MRKYKQEAIDIMNIHIIIAKTKLDELKQKEIIFS